MECEMRREGELGYAKRFDLDTFEVELGGVADGVGEEVSVDSGGEEAVKGLSKKKGKCKIGEGNEKAVVALKNHSEAERRRRERINGHLDVLRGLLGSNEKMDKASLLAEVINQVKELQNQVRHVSKGLLIPYDADELTVEPLIHNEAKNGFITFKATLCCDFRPDIFSDLKQAIRSLNLNTLHAEISTLGGERVKTLFILSSRSNTETQENLSNAIYQSLSSVVNKATTLPEYSPRTNLSNKRFKTSLEDYSPRSVLSNKRFKYSSLESSSSSEPRSTESRVYMKMCVEKTRLQKENFYYCQTLLQDSL